MVGQVTAIDIDSGSFGQVAYGLAGPGANRWGGMYGKCVSGRVWYETSTFVI